MTTIHFQLGRETELCRFELLNILALHGFGPPTPDASLPAVAIEEGALPTLIECCKTLGGSIRAIEELGVYSGDFLLDLEGGRYFIPAGAWGASALDENLQREREEVRQAVKRLVKAEAEAHGREERPRPGEPEISPARVQEAGLDQTGSELCLWTAADRSVRVGVTRWVFDTHEFGKRDMEKPFRPQRRGLLPPKLARQMINLGRTSATWRMLDPFCGSGVTLMEGLSLGFQVAGSDNRDEAISQSKKNLEWFLPKGGGEMRSRVAFLERIDARQLSTKIDPLSFDLVVGEGDLGPPIQGRLSRKAAIEFSARLEPLYVRAFAEIRILLRPKGRVSLAVPFWQPNEGDPIFINLDRKLRTIGFGPAFEEKGFDPFLYRRKDQKVGRAIFVLESPD